MIDLAEVEYALNLEQGSPEWLAFKCGKVSASRIADITARLRNGDPAASRLTYMGQLIAERLTGVPAETYSNAAMEWGRLWEPVARAAYQFERLCTVEQVGIVLHPEIPGSLASPDGLIGDDGLVEIKCPQTGTHIETVLSRTIPGRYQQQMQWQLACTGRSWCDFVSYDPRMPEHMRIWIKRLERDAQRISQLELEVASFLDDMVERIRDLQNVYEADTSALACSAGQPVHVAL